MLVKITFEIDDDIWGFSDAIDNGCDEKAMLEVAQEDPIALLEMAKNFRVEKIAR